MFEEEVKQAREEGIKQEHERATEELGNAILVAKQGWVEQGRAEGRRERNEEIWKWVVNNGITDKKSFIALRDFLTPKDK